MDRLDQVVSDIHRQIKAYRVELVDAGEFFSDLNEPMEYGEVRSLVGPRSCEVKGKKARLQVVVERFGAEDGRRAGMYELVCYVA